MSNPKFFAGKLDLITFTMSLTENASYPLSNLNTYNPNDLWKSPAATNAQILIMDAGSALPFDTLILQGDNFSGMTTVKLQVDANDSATFANPVDVATLSGHSTANPIYLATFASITKRYRRILFTDTNSIIPQLGQIFLSAVFDAGFTYIFPYKSNNLQYATTRKRALDGTLRTAQVYGGIRTFEIKFETMPDSFKTAWIAFHKSVRGALCPFYFVDVDSTLSYLALTNDSNDIETLCYNINNGGSILMETQSAE